MTAAATIFSSARDGRAGAARAKSRPYLFAGIQLLHRRAFDGIPAGAFRWFSSSTGREQAGRLHAIVHDGEWYHVGTPDGLAATRDRLSRTASSDSREASLALRRTTAAAQVYTIAARAAVSGDAREGLIELAGGDPLRLPQMTVLLPTRRAVRACARRFCASRRRAGAPARRCCCRGCGRSATSTIDELASARGGGADDPTLDVPPAIPELRRRLLLTRLVLGWSDGAAATAAVARAGRRAGGGLARLLDNAADGGRQFRQIARSGAGGLAEHWQIVLRFLEILPSLGRRYSRAEGRARPGRAAQPPVAAPGGAVAGQPSKSAGHRRRPDRRHAGPDRAPVGDRLARPGHGHSARARPRLRRRRMGADRRGADPSAAPECAAAARSLELAATDVRDWPLTPDPPRQTRAGRERRLRLVAEALRPAAATDAWRDLPAGEPPDVLAGVARYDCASPQDEATTIALLLRRNLEIPGATAALVTPDRELARRVAAELRRWDIDIDDSAGMPLNRTPPGTFLRLVLDLADSALAPVPLLAALKHPLAAGGLAPETFRERARRLEAAIRGPAPGARLCRVAGGARSRKAAAARLRRPAGGLPRRLGRSAGARSRAAGGARRGACRGGRAAGRHRRRERRRAAVA